ncbi:CAAX protease self-immunity [Lentzea xinjiangensis]|uniref:CAAX protease self-immunity n=1 Tax=Lentzea xinjiangensis TaxID=402600 RepID=A0A1H9R8V4_9PSEU|nr:type II CAAX endopeptidase family protein [Lentzea xinjiangensis]SER69037.1 CAAX protease self-immunity [Lentzea xinjiangensis]
MSRPVGTFLAIAFTVPWLLWLLRLGTGVDVIAPGGMLAAGLATLVTVRRFGLRDTGLRRQPPWQVAAALAAVLGLALLAVVIGGVTGVLRLDLAGFSGLHQVHGGGPVGEVLLTAVARSGLLFGLVLPLAFCEEWGWRGFLLPRLLRFGRWGAFGLSGLIWAVWHLPGYTGRATWPAFVPFAVFTVLFGALLGELRLRTGSVWACAVAHAANNTLVIGLVNVAFTDAAELAAPDPWSTGLSGWPGWVVMAAVIAVLAVTTRRKALAA